jgi:hypothetical protein
VNGRPFSFSIRRAPWLTSSAATLSNIYLEFEKFSPVCNENADPNVFAHYQPFWNTGFCRR